ncbi:unnamed protein product [Ixodes hexagonus]
MTTTRSLSQQSFEVEHDEANKEFFIRLGKDKAVLQYDVVDPKTLDLVHTEVPEALRGKGIAKHLAKAAFNFVAANNLQAKVTCPYVDKYVKDEGDSKHQTLVVK